MSDLISKKELLEMLDKIISESEGDTPIVDAVLSAVKNAVGKMPTAKDNFCTICKWRELALEKRELALEKGKRK